jgi:hypothetical protein
MSSLHSKLALEKHNPQQKQGKPCPQTNKACVLTNYVAPSFQHHKSLVTLLNWSAVTKNSCLVTKNPLPNLQNYFSHPSFNLILV